MYMGDGAVRPRSYMKLLIWLCYGNYLWFVCENNGYAMNFCGKNVILLTDIWNIGVRLRDAMWALEGMDPLTVS